MITIDPRVTIVDPLVTILCVTVVQDQTYECDDDVDDEDKIAERRARREEQRRERRREHRERERRRRKLRLREDEWEDEETEAEETEEEEEEEERGWQAERRLRRCREQISYKFEEYDELIRSAIRDDVVEDTPAAESRKSTTESRKSTTESRKSATESRKSPPSHISHHRVTYVTTESRKSTTESRKSATESRQSATVTENKLLFSLDHLSGQLLPRWRHSSACYKCVICRLSSYL